MKELRWSEKDGRGLTKKTIVSPLPFGKEGWLKAGVVGERINLIISHVYSPTTSPYGYSSFPKEENEVTAVLFLSVTKEVKLYSYKSANGVL